MSEDLAEQANRISQSIVDRGTIQKIHIDGVYQVFKKHINQKIHLEPGEEIPDFDKNFFMEMSVLNGVTADTVIIENVIQKIILINNQYVTITSEELARLIYDSLSVIFDPQASRENKKLSIVWVLKSIIDRDNFPSDQKESFQKLYSEIENMLVQDFDTAINSKDSKVKQQIGQVIIFASGTIVGGTAVGVTVVLNYEAIIQELKKYNTKPSLDSQNAIPSNSDTSEENNLRNTKKPRGDDKYPPAPKKQKRFPNDVEEIKSGRRVPSENNLSTGSHEIDKSLTGINNPNAETLPQAGNPGISSNSQPNLPSISSENIGNIFPSNSANGIHNSDIPLSKLIGGITSNLPPVTSYSNTGDCDGCDCDGCDCDGCEIGCFIATAVYGDYNASQVVTLRNFRDTKLMPHFIGRLFVEKYYLFSPPIAKKLKYLPRTSQLIRHVLDMIVKWLEH
jgi:hypothetical protein